MPVNLSVSGAA